MAHDTIEDALNEFGELLVITDAGEQYELHNHNVTFEDGWIIIEGTAKDLFVDDESIESFEIHYDV